MMNGCPRWSFLAVPLLAALGCSDPVPRPPQAGLTLSIQQPTTNVSEKSCPKPGKTYIVGNPNGPTNMVAGDRLIDGEHGASINCSVKGNGPYTFSGTIKGTTKQSDTVTVTITNGQVNADKLTGTAQIGVFTNDLLQTFTSANDGCVVNVVSQQVKAGSIWATLSCPSITNPPSGLCSVGPSTTIVFENCDGA